MPGLRRAMVALLLAVGLLAAGLLATHSVARAQSAAPIEQLLTPDEVSIEFEGDWSGGCSAVASAVECSFEQPVAEGAGQVTLVFTTQGAAPGALTRDQWRTFVQQTASSLGAQLQLVAGLGDEAYLWQAKGASYLDFWSNGTEGQMTARIDGVDPGTGMGHLAGLALSRLDGVALPTGAPIPSLVAPTYVPVGTPSGTVQMPGFVGYTLEGAAALARAYGLNMAAGRADGSQTSITDIVQSQDPAVGTPIPVGATISLIVAPVGAAPSPVPTPVPTPVPGVPTPAPSPPVAAPIQAPGPSDISLDPVVIATSAVAAAGIVLLIPFPSALFNSTLEENYEEIRGWFRFRRRRPGGAEPVVEPEPDAVLLTSTGRPIPSLRELVDGFWRTKVGVASFFLIAGVMYGFLDPSFGFSVGSALTLAGILIALAVGTLASTGTLRWSRERLNGERGRFRILPATLIVALVCVLVTRITDFQPGYLYGVLAGLVFVTTVGERETGHEVARTVSVVALVGLLAFLVLGIVRALEGGGGPTGAWIPVDVALSALVIGGFEGLLFGMIPLRGLPGAKVKDWDARAWAVLLFLGAVAFLHIIVNPSSGYLVNTTVVPLAKAVILLVAFGGVSVGLWAWFRYRPMDRGRARRAAHEPPPGDAPGL